MSEKPIIKVGHLKITDHLILGITNDLEKSKTVTFDHFQLETTTYLGWNQVSDAMKGGTVDVCFLLAPTAMDTSPEPYATLFVTMAKPYFHLCLFRI
mgnify:CR=1 FL=1